jgi:hypothetical protein
MQKKSAVGNVVQRDRRHRFSNKKEIGAVALGEFPDKNTLPLCGALSVGEFLSATAPL